jgi:hypothetical protein
VSGDCTGRCASLSADLEIARARAITPAQREMYDAIVTCFDTCQGMVRYSTEESDRYWELAEDLMAMLGKSIGQPVLRVAEDAEERAEREDRMREEAAGCDRINASTSTFPNPEDEL